MRIFGCMGQRKVKSMDSSKKPHKWVKSRDDHRRKKLKIQMIESVQISTKPNACNFRQHSNAFFLL